MMTQLIELLLCWLGVHAPDWSDGDHSKLDCARCGERVAPW